MLCCLLPVTVWVQDRGSSYKASHAPSEVLDFLIYPSTNLRQRLGQSLSALPLSKNTPRRNFCTFGFLLLLLSSFALSVGLIFFFFIASGWLYFWVGLKNYIGQKVVYFVQLCSSCKDYTLPFLSLGDVSLSCVICFDTACFLDPDKQSSWPLPSSQSFRWPLGNPGFKP